MADDNRNLANIQQNGVQAINGVADAIKKAFPQVGTLATSAGSASGKYMTITGTDGNPYKIALLNP